MSYILFFASLSIIILTWDRKVSNVALVVLLSVGLALFAALRAEHVAADFITYQAWYNEGLSFYGYVDRPLYFESIYFALMQYLSSAGLNFRVFIFFIAFFSSAVKIETIFFFGKKTDAKLIAFLAYCLSFYLLHDFTQIRVGLCIAILYGALKFRIEEKYFMATLLVLIASGIHTAAVLIFPLMLPLYGWSGRLIDGFLYILVFTGYLLIALSIQAPHWVLDILTGHDQRLNIYLAISNEPYSLSANPLSFNSIIILMFTFSLITVNKIRGSSFSIPSDLSALLIIRRSFLMGLIALIFFYQVPEIGLRTFEFYISFTPILIVILFSFKDQFFIQKSLIIIWMIAVSYVYIFRVGSLVNAYEIFF